MDNKIPTYDSVNEIPYEFCGICIIGDIWECYVKNGVPHKVDGPAVSSTLTHKNYSLKEWWISGNRHRLDGPAIEFARTEKNKFYINNNIIEEKNFWNHPMVIKNKLNKILSND